MSSTGKDSSQHVEETSEMSSDSTNQSNLNTPSKMSQTLMPEGFTTPVKSAATASNMNSPPTSSYKTPVKGSYTPSSVGSGFRSPSFSSPSSKGQSEDLVGYLITVGQVQKSRKKNNYYLLQVQVAKFELIAVMIMVNGSNPAREAFLPFCTQPIKLNMVFPGDGGYFFYKNRGSTFEVTDELQYTIDELMSPLQLVQTKKSGKYHVKGMLRWLGDVEEHNNGGHYRWALLGDVSGIIKLKVWKEAWFDFNEQTVYLLTNLQIQEYFGVYLSTVFDSAYAISVEQIVPSWPTDVESMVKKSDRKTAQSAEINSVAMSASALCPDCNENIPLADGEYLECVPCDRTFKSRKCKFHLVGSIEVEGVVDDAPITVSLAIDSNNIDEMFGEGTVRRYGRNLKELKLRLLQQQNLEIIYVAETKKITSMTVEQEVPQKRKKDNEYHD